MKKLLFLSILLITSVLINCSTTTKVKQFNNTTTPMGKPKYYQTTTNIAVHFFFGLIPIHDKLGNSSFEQTLDDFTDDAVKNRAPKVHIIQRETTRYWYILLPFTIILTPVSTELTGFVQD
ncbi:MAG TPA: hypothetical protein PK079_20660 [Leptospiraceae bacterium]|nr:hypothetical protein [Leptospiraceae bacterium]HMW06380.1 hypothetical protein [Leptospiraceae bacterium]HMX31708.1 hypothetical protein [Leptospiraceae bacterium]HMY31994.1 hypothetical protein [Leptospiraceae bacterium]HMZ65793.1 hypothetical protein [Leptospiraceae bacterium]